VEICDGSTPRIIADHTETLRLGDLQTVKVGMGRVTPYGGGIGKRRCCMISSGLYPASVV
jgi:hypothetical protein